MINQGHEPGRYVVDRGWSVHVGAVRVARWHRCYAGEAGIGSVAARAPARLRGRAYVGVIVFSLCTLAVTGLLGERVLAGQSYSVTIPVPPTLRHVMAGRQGHASANLHHAAAHSAVRREVAVVVPAQTAAPPNVLSEGAVQTDEPAAAPLSRAVAMKTALLSGDMQEWQDASGVRGFVVAGPLEQDEGGRCRTLALLTRATSGDSVEQRRECLR